MGGDAGVAYGDAFSGSSAGHWAILAVFTTVFLAGAAAVIRRRTTN